MTTVEGNTPLTPSINQERRFRTGANQGWSPVFFVLNLLVRNCVFEQVPVFRGQSLIFGTADINRLLLAGFVVLPVLEPPAAVDQVENGSWHIRVVCCSAMPQAEIHEVAVTHFGPGHHGPLSLQQLFFAELGFRRTIAHSMRAFP